MKRGAQAGSQRFSCHGCGSWFTKSSQPERNHRDQILNDHLDGISYRKLVSRYPVGKNALCRIVNDVTAALKPNLDVTQHFFPQCAYSGTHIVDGKYIPAKEVVRMTPRGKVPRSWKRQKVKRGMVLVWGADYGTHDILHHEFGLSENVFLYGNYFKALKELGYRGEALHRGRQERIVRRRPRLLSRLCPPTLHPSLCGQDQQDFRHQAPHRQDRFL